MKSQLSGGGMSSANLNDPDNMNSARSQSLPNDLKSPNK